MVTLRLVLGIISCIFTPLIFMQSCAVGAVNTLQEAADSMNEVARTTEVSGSAGAMLAICLLISGIILIVGRKSKIATIIAICFYIFASLVALANIGTFKDLEVYGYIALIFAILSLISCFGKKKKTTIA